MLDSTVFFFLIFRAPYFILQREDFSKGLIINHLEALKVRAEKILSTKFFNLLKDNIREDVSKITRLPGTAVNDLDEWKVISELLITKNNV